MSHSRRPDRGEPAALLRLRRVPARSDATSRTPRGMSVFATARPAKEHRRMQEQNPAERKKGSGRWWIVGVAGAFVVAALVATLLIFTGKDEPAVANAPAANQTTSKPTEQKTARDPANL